MSYLLIGNIFSFLSVLALGRAVLGKSKKDFVFWCAWNSFLGVLTNLALFAYAATINCLMNLFRDYMSYRGKLTKRLTFILLILSTLIGIYINNRGLIGLFPIIASGEYTLCLYWTQNEQQLRWALVVNLALWIIHNVYIQAYPSSIGHFALLVWTLFNIMKYHRDNKISQRGKTTEKLSGLG